MRKYRDPSCSVDLRGITLRLKEVHPILLDSRKNVLSLPRKLAGWETRIGNRVIAQGKPQGNLVGAPAFSCLPLLGATHCSDGFSGHKLGLFPCPLREPHLGPHEAEDQAEAAAMGKRVQ